MLSLAEHEKSFITSGPDLNTCSNFGRIDNHFIMEEIFY